MKKARAAACFAVFFAIVAGILLIPTPLRVKGTLVLTPAKPGKVYPEVEGRLVDLNVRDGAQVKKGDLLASLSNPQKLRERVDLNQQHDVHFVKYEALRRSMNIDDYGLARQHLDHARDLEPALNKINEQIGKLDLYAPRDGVAVGVPEPETKGQWIKPGGKPFCEVADPHKLEAHLILDQSDVDLIDEKSTAWIKIYGNSEETIQSWVQEIAKRNREEIPPELSNLAGGEIATKPDQKTGEAKPITAVFEVIIPVNNRDLNLEIGQRGFAKIDGGYRSVGWWLWRMITKTFHFTL